MKRVTSIFLTLGNIDDGLKIACQTIYPDWLRVTDHFQGNPWAPGDKQFGDQYSKMRKNILIA